MSPSKQRPTETVDDYVAGLPADVQTILQELRHRIAGVVPGSAETISYHIPTITLRGNSVVSFAAWKHHIGIYPMPAGDEALARDLAPYRSATSTGRFPFVQPMPYELIERLVLALVAESHQTG